MVDQPQQSTMEEIKCIVRSLAISGSSKGLTARDLARDFKNMEGYELPFRRLGFSSVEQFLGSLKDTVRVNGLGPTATVDPVVTQSNKHIRELVNASKTNNNWNRNKKPNMTSNYRPKTYNSSNNYNGRSNGNHSGGNRFHEKSNGNNRQTEPRKVFNSEFDYYDGDAIDENDSESSDDQPKFTMNGTSKLQQVQEPAPTSRDAIPDSDALDFVNSLEVPSDAMNVGDKIEMAKVPPSIVSKGSIRVFVTEVHNPNRLWYHIGDNVGKIDDMMNEIEAYYGQLPREEWRLKPGNARTGFYCMAKFHGQWHRARIVSEYEHSKLKVFYIDYGTVALVELRDLKYMAKIFADVPAQAMRASLAYVKPVNHRWTRDASWSLLSLVYEKLLYAYVVDVDRVDNVLHVVLIDTSGPQDYIVNQQLFVKGHAVWEDDLPYKEKSHQRGQNLREAPRGQKSWKCNFIRLYLGENSTDLDYSCYIRSGRMSRITYNKVDPKQMRLL
ncbi:conserved hypothetical protein [Culex quinquefasciatus]|uniref:Tudor domain-containing protein n=1 Tax=Culex quinquefasciatus TaxID=7176 RepID=B0W2W2_CULQU|nr:conserved hypothetical protein [Culex quinquefasciatus]|eukprot:XP_001843046.1 conserved hypothetical protein [Culex quinquefasciatus]